MLEPETDKKKFSVGRAAAVAAAHAVFGPPLGGLACVMIALILSPFLPSKTGETEAELAGVAFLLLVTTVIFLIPFLSAGIYLAARIYFSGSYRITETSAVITTSLLLLLAIKSQTKPVRFRLEDLSNLMDFYVPLLTSASICAALLCRWLLVWAEVISDTKTC